MVLIFGWGGGPVEDRGEVAALRCPNCHNAVYFHKIRSTKQVSLFFVPVMPYGTDEYLICPVCRHGLQIAPSHQSTVEGMRAATSLVREGRITEPSTVPGRTRSGSRWAWRRRSVSLPVAATSRSGSGAGGGAPRGRPADRARRSGFGRAGIGAGDPVLVLGHTGGLGAPYQGQVYFSSVGAPGRRPSPVLGFGHDVGQRWHSLPRRFRGAADYATGTTG